MYEGCVAELRMLKNILEDGEIDEDGYICEIMECDEEKEKIHLLLREGTLQNLFLDGVYECIIRDNEETVVCEGMIKERYVDKKGRNIIFLLENGFYKNSLK